MTTKVETICKVEECDRPIVLYFKKRLCNAHYWRSRNGVPLDSPIIARASNSEEAKRKAKDRALMRARRQSHYLKHRKSLLAKQKYRCGICGVDVRPIVNVKHALSIDHIIPMSRGGTDEIDNLQIACTKCNMRKGNKTMREVQHLRTHDIDDESVSQFVEANLNRILPGLAGLIEAFDDAVASLMSDDSCRRQRCEHSPCIVSLARRGRRYCKRHEQDRMTLIFKEHQACVEIQARIIERRRWLEETLGSPMFESDIAEARPKVLDALVSRDAFIE